MGKFSAILGITLLIGVAVSYPTWSQYAQTQGQALFDQSNSTSDSAFNSTAVNASLPDSETTDNSSTTYDGPVVTTTQTVPAAVQLDSTWVSQFFTAISSDRNGTSLSPCASLDAFAAQRFQTMTTGTNWEVTHFGYTQDEGEALGGTPGFFAEEYFYSTLPQPVTPQAFVNHVQTTAPGHWTDLMSPAYQYYGVDYQGTGPVLLFQSNCGPTELGAGVNVTQAYSGCSHQQVSGAWLVIELGSVCPLS